jgi:hypothetical protein
MTPTDQAIHALWASVFGEPPPVTAAPELLIKILVRHLPLAPPYGEVFAAINDPIEASEGSLSASADAAKPE